MGANRFGNFVDSRLVWQAQHGDDKHAIFGKAVREGSVSKVADDIKAVHTQRQAIILDEATAIPDAIWDAISNMWSYPEEFLLIVLFNPRSRLDAAGRFIEPAGGWNSVTVNDEEWEGKPQAEYGGRVPYVIRFDAEQSPNILENRLVSRHLPQREKVDASRRNAANSPLHWSNMRGFPPPDGIAKTVFTETMLAQHDGFGRHVFLNQTTVIGFLDPAFGGNDNPILTFALIGQTADNRWGIQCFEPMILPLDVTKKNTIHYQLADAVISLCDSFVVNGRKYHCPMENFGMDATGEGGGLASIIERKSGSAILWVEFGSSASEDTVNIEDGRKACEVYKNKRAEMHFRTRDTLQSGQLKGISREAGLELCRLKFDDEKGRIVIMAKKDYKLEFRSSPDYGDSLVGISEVARIRGFRLAAVEQSVNRMVNWEREVEQSQQVYTETQLYQPEEMDAEAASH